MIGVSARFADMSDSSVAFVAEVTNRATRRRLKTRSALVRAAYEVIAEKGLAGMTIQDVTDRADVANGSFYNHFSSKEEIFDAACETFVESFGNAVDTVRDFVEDPAEVIVVSERFNLQRAFDDPVWGPFQLQHSLVRGSMNTGLARRLQRDLQIALDAGKVRFEDPRVALTVVGGASMGMYVGISEGIFGRDELDVLEREFAQLIGIADDDIDALIQRPLPPIDLSGVP